MKNIVLAVAALAILSACSTDPSQEAQIKTDYTLPPKIGIDVQSVSFVNRATPERPPSIYDKSDPFQPTVAGAIRKWSDDRLAAVGASGVAVLTVNDASMKREAMPTKSSFDKVFDRQQASKYVGHASVTLEVRKDDGYATASAEASRWASMPDDPTDEERRKAYFTVLNGLMRDLGQNLESSIHEHMGNLVRTAPAGAGDTDAPVIITPASTK